MYLIFSCNLCRVLCVLRATTCHFDIPKIFVQTEFGTSEAQKAEESKTGMRCADL